MQETAEQLDLTAAVRGTLRRNQGGPGRFLRSLAEAYVDGAPVSWAGARQADRESRSGLPPRLAELLADSDFGAGEAADPSSTPTSSPRGPAPDWMPSSCVSR